MITKFVRGVDILKFEAFGYLASLPRWRPKFDSRRRKYFFVFNLIYPIFYIFCNKNLVPFYTKFHALAKCSHQPPIFFFFFFFFFYIYVLRKVRIGTILELSCAKWEFSVCCAIPEL